MLVGLARKSKVICFHYLPTSGQPGWPTRWFWRRCWHCADSRWKHVKTMTVYSQRYANACYMLHCKGWSRPFGPSFCFHRWLPHSLAPSMSKGEVCSSGPDLRINILQQYNLYLYIIHTKLYTMRVYIYNDIHIIYLLIYTYICTHWYSLVWSSRIRYHIIDLNNLI